MASILVVDDDIDANDALCRYLIKVGHHVRSPHNGQEALDMILESPPNLILLDMMMPEMDGSELLEILRSYLRLQSLPVILWTGVTDSLTAEQARRLKVNAILVKAVTTFEQIGQAIDQGLHHEPQ